ncbi:MAG: enoyl-CoA hydratase/isomerase family protein [Actinomycetota bacterium]|nr:enoyl-CoA hydratase/isomerase family protein [Actinomycetota bacterium]
MISLEQRDGLTELSLKSPERRNALDRATLGSLVAALGDETGVSGALILSGSEGVFSAGADLSELQGTTADLGFDALLAEVVGAIERQPRLVVSVVEGPCMGAAVELALACDICIASADAFFELPAVRLGILYSPASIARLHATLPRQALTRLLLMGERLNAQTALQLGMVTMVASKETALPAARDLARAVSSANSDAIDATKQLLRALDRGERDLDRFEADRIRLVASPSRRAALEAARVRRRGAGGEVR